MRKLRKAEKPGLLGTPRIFCRAVGRDLRRQIDVAGPQKDKYGNNLENKQPPSAKLNICVSAKKPSPPLAFYFG